MWSMGRHGLHGHEFEVRSSGAALSYASEALRADPDAPWKENLATLALAAHRKDQGIRSGSG